MIELLGNGDNENIAMYAKRTADSVFNWSSRLMVENENRLDYLMTSMRII